MSNQHQQKCQSGMVPLIAILILMLEACATVDAERIEYAGAPHFPSTDPDTVKILREEPTEPNERLGEVFVDASIEPSPPVAEVEKKLREEAGKLGADAVIIVYDNIQPTVVFVNPWWTGNVRSVTGRKVIGVAIKYQENVTQRPG